MLNFEQLVESLLLEGTNSSAVKFASTVKNTTEADLEYLFTNVIRPGGSVTAINSDICERILDYIGVLDAIIRISGNKSLKDLRSALTSKPEWVQALKAGADGFYTQLESMPDYTKINAMPLTAIKIGNLLPDVQELYRKGITAKASSAIKENVFNTLTGETIIDALVKIFQTRLNKLQQAKISINMLVGHITNLRMSTYDVFLKDLFFNVTNYASGKKPANSDIVDVLQSIRVDYEHLIDIALQTNKLYTAYLRRNYPKWNDPSGMGNDKVIYDKYNTPQQMYVFAKEGKLIGSSGPGKGATLISGYNLNKIQADNTEEGKELINKIKDICAGVNEGPGASERFAAAGAAGAAVAAAGGVKQGFAM